MSTDVGLEPDAEEPDPEEIDRIGGVGDIAGGVHTLLTDALGPVHAGTGHQVNISSLYLQTETGFRRSGADRLRHLAADRTRYLDVRFVQPPGFERARELLNGAGAVFVTGRPGVGRQAAALMLLHLTGDSQRRLWETTGLESGDRVPDEEPIEAGDRVLVDLSVEPAETANSPAGAHTVEAYRRVAGERGAQLVVVLPTEYGQIVRDSLRHLVVQLQRPDGEAVFRRHLAADGIERPELDQTAQEHLRTDSMAELARFAALVREARERAVGVGGPAEWVHEALPALADWSTEVAQELRENQDGRTRALLLAAALFEGAGPDAVHAAAAELLVTMRYRPPEDHVFDQPDLAQRLGDIGVRTEHGAVRFTRLAYDAAVRTHFWRYFPDLRDHLRDWVRDAIQLPALTGDDRDRAVGRAAEQFLGTERVNDVFELATRWSAPATQRRLAPLAAEILERALAEQQVGWQVRRQLYFWATNYRLHRDFALVLVAVCADVLAGSHPEQALVRLHHLARNDAPAVRDEAASRLANLVDADQRFFRATFDRLAAVSFAAAEVRAPDLALFLHLTGCRRVLAAPEQYRARGSWPARVREVLLAGWAAAFHSEATEARTAALHLWLHATVERRGRGPLLLLLIDALAGSVPALGELYLAVGSWAGEAGDPGEYAARRAIADDVRQRCRMAVHTAQPTASEEGD